MSRSKDWQWREAGGGHGRSRAGAPPRPSELERRAELKRLAARQSDAVQLRRARMMPQEKRTSVAARAIQILLERGPVSRTRSIWNDLSRRAGKDARIATLRRWHEERPEFSSALVLLLPLLMVAGLVSIRAPADSGVSGVAGLQTSVARAWEDWVPPWAVAEVARRQRNEAAERAIIAAGPELVLPMRSPEIVVARIELPGIRSAGPLSLPDRIPAGRIDLPHIALSTTPPHVDVAAAMRRDQIAPEPEKRDFAEIALPAQPFTVPQDAPHVEVPATIVEASPILPEPKVAQAVCRPEDKTLPQDRARTAAQAVLSASAPDDAFAFGRALAAAAIEQGSDLVVYDARYVRIAYPAGDVTQFYGVCSDVIVRAYRALGIDLQELVHRSRATGGDANIDHRRTEVLRAFFARHGEQLPNSLSVEEYLPGDIVTYYRPQNKSSTSHIAIVTDVIAPSGRPMIVHNRGWGVQLEDALFVDQITGHYRFRGLTEKQMAALPRRAPEKGSMMVAGARDGAVRSVAVRPIEIASDNAEATLRGSMLPEDGRRSDSERQIVSSTARGASTTQSRKGRFAAPMGLGLAKSAASSGPGVRR